MLTGQKKCRPPTLFSSSGCRRKSRFASFTASGPKYSTSAPTSRRSKHCGASAGTDGTWQGLRVSVPQFRAAAAANQRFRLAKAILTYDLPAQGRKAETIEANIVVEYTRNAERGPRTQRGCPPGLGPRAEVQRQILFVQAKADLLNRHEGSDRDRVLVANVLHALIKKFDEWADRAMANQFRQMEEQLRKKEKPHKICSIALSRPPPAPKKWSWPETLTSSLSRSVSAGAAAKI